MSWRSWEENTRNWQIQLKHDRKRNGRSSHLQCSPDILTYLYLKQWWHALKKPHNLHDSCEPTSLADVRPEFSYASLMLLMSLFFFHLSISRSPFQFSQEGFGNHLLSKSLNATWLQLDEAVGSSNPKWTGHDPPQFIAIHVRTRFGDANLARCIKHSSIGWTFSI